MLTFHSLRRVDTGMSSHIHIISCMLFQELLGTFFTDYVLSTSERYLRKALDRYKEVLLMFAQSVDQQGQVPYWTGTFFIANEKFKSCLKKYN